MDQKVELLRKVPLLAELSHKELAQVSQLSEEVDLPAGHVLMREGATGNEFWLIVDGTVEVTREGTLIRTMGPGSFLGEIALVDHGPRTATAVATTPIHAIVLGIREFHSLMDAFPVIQAAVMRALAQRVRNLEPDTH